MAGAEPRKLYAHAKLRRLRREHGFNQVELARELGISTSYLNQIEQNQRPLTASVLLRITEVLGVGAEYFSDAEHERLATDLRAALADEACGPGPAPEEIAEVARAYPDTARALVTLHRRYRDAAERVAVLADPADAAALAPAEPHDAVRDFFYAHHNHFGALDELAERTAGELRTARGHLADALAERLAARHGVTVVQAAGTRPGDVRRFDAASGLVFLSPELSDGQRAFQLATQLALLEHGPLLGSLAEGVGGSPDSVALARIGLADYFAGALLMPYTEFHAAAEELRYDIELLQARFGVGFETVPSAEHPSAHRPARGAVLVPPGGPRREHLQAPVRDRLPLLPARRHLPAVDGLRGLLRPRPGADAGG